MELEALDEVVEGGVQMEVQKGGCAESSEIYLRTRFGPFGVISDPSRVQKAGAMNLDPGCSKGGSRSI